MRKMIYFPPIGRDPFVIFSDGFATFAREYKGSRTEEDWGKGEYKMYAADRCRSYSDALWEACLDWKRRRDEINAEYEDMMRRLPG